MSPVVIWKISITFLDHQYKSTHKLEWKLRSGVSM
jgi:hypothetical protein